MENSYNDIIFKFINMNYGSNSSTYNQGHFMEKKCVLLFLPIHLLFESIYKVMFVIPPFER